MAKCLRCEGYIMFEGSAEIRFKDREPFVVSGVWLYKPDMDFWYVNHCAEFPWGSSFPAECVTPLTEGDGVL